MRYQSRKSSCGPAALRNALDLLGIERAEDELIKLCGTTAIDGTSPSQLLSALATISLSASEILLGRAVGNEIAIAVLHRHVCQGRPLLLLVDKWEHWVVVAGLLGNKLLVLDSADNEGTLIYNEQDLATRWLHPRFGYYGISLH